MGKKKQGVRIKQVGPKQPPMIPNPMEALANIPADEMVHLPPPPDRSYQVIWPIHETFSMNYKSFQVIYPSYLDSNKTIKEGRRLPHNKSVPSPSVVDLSQALQRLQVRHVLQPYKGYSRDLTCMWENPGRVLVDVTNYSKKQLLQELAARIVDLPERVARMQRAEEERVRIAEERKKLLEAEAGKKSAVTTAKKAVATNKKKGKKGKK
jgi:signal recognition particle subunit SRP19